MIIKIEDSRDSTWFHYMTSWNYMLAVFYFVYVLIKFGLNRRRGKRNSSNHHDAEMANRNDEASKNQSQLALDGPDSSGNGASTNTAATKSDKFMYFLFSISYTMCFMVVIIYWILLFDPKEYKEKSHFEFFMTVDRHGIIFVLIFIQYLLNKIPVRILHAIYVVIIAFLFFVHTYFYYLATDKLVYTIFDWNEAPGKAIGYAFGMSLACFILQFIIFFIDLLKHKIAGK